MGGSLPGGKGFNPMFDGGKNVEVGQLLEATLQNLMVTQKDLAESFATAEKPNGIAQQSVSQWIKEGFVPQNRIPGVIQFFERSLHNIENSPDGQPSRQWLDTIRYQVKTLTDALQHMSDVVERNKRQGIAALKAFMDAQKNAQDIIDSQIINTPGIQQLRDSLEQYQRQAEHLAKSLHETMAGFSYGFVPEPIAMRSKDMAIKAADERKAVKDDIKEAQASAKATSNIRVKAEVVHPSKRYMAKMEFDAQVVNMIQTFLPGNPESRIEVNGRELAVDYQTTDGDLFEYVLVYLSSKGFVDTRPLYSRIAKAALIQRTTGKKLHLAFVIDEPFKDNKDTIIARFDQVIEDCLTLDITPHVIWGDWHEVFNTLYTIETGETFDWSELYGIPDEF
jgi:hypothetical protein